MFRFSVPRNKLSIPQDVWPFSDSATVASGLLLFFWLGLLIGVFGAKGGLL